MSLNHQDNHFYQTMVLALILKLMPHYLKVSKHKHHLMLQLLADILSPEQCSLCLAVMCGGRVEVRVPARKQSRRSTTSLRCVVVGCTQLHRNADGYCHSHRAEAAAALAGVLSDHGKREGEETWEETYQRAWRFVLDGIPAGSILDTSVENVEGMLNAQYAQKPRRRWRRRRTRRRTGLLHTI